MRIPVWSAKFSFLVLLVSAFATSSLAVPFSFNVQGRLTDADGLNRAGDDFSIKFGIYDASAGGLFLWGRTLDGVPMRNGNFQVTLEDPASEGQYQQLRDVFAGDSLFLQFQVTRVNGVAVTELSVQPRLQILSVPYALVAQEAEGETIPRGVIVAWSGSLGSEIFNNGWCLCDGRSCSGAATPDLSDSFVMGGDLAGIGTTGGGDDPVIDPPGVWTSGLSGWSFHSEPGLTKYYLGRYYIGLGAHRRHLLDIPPFHPGVKALYPKFYKLAYIMKI